LFRLVYLSLVFLLFSCGKPLERQSNSNHSKIQKIDKSKSIEMNKLWVKDEIFKIDQYCLRYGWNMVISKSGMRYQIIQSENSTIKPIIGSEVTMSYDVRLMDSKQTKCYHSDSNGLAKFKVEKSLIESGINEVVSMLRKGDSALVILPHHIAHGLTGDSKKIPPLSTVLYFIKILDVHE
jgi:FKBP-type peptidyl-prolyl cis-trans isomerase FkpA